MIDVRGKRVLVVGLARSGRAAARSLVQRGAVVTVTDSRPPSAFQDEIRELTAQKVGLELGLHREETFLRQDLIVVSPGVPGDLAPLLAARQRKIPVVPEVELASRLLNADIVGITGSNGKTTTTALLAKMLEASGIPAFVGGNIGVPLIAALDRPRRDAILVTELSSFQLEAIQSFRPRVAVLLNLSPNHLDRHQTFEAYVAAKARIFRNQTADDYAILNADDPQVVDLAPAIASRKIFFSRRQNLPAGVFVSNGHICYRVGNLERALLETREILLRGDFNVENVLAAAAAACTVGADFEAQRQAVREFCGIEHRLECAREIRGVKFYNDSKATSVDATAKALSAFDKGVHLILGGKDKGAPYAPLRPLLEGRVREVLLIGAAAQKIERELAGAAKLVRAGDLETAVREAFKLAVPGDIVLLAPACASFDQFQDYEHRGRAFKKIVENLSRGVTSSETAQPIVSAPPPAATAPAALPASSTSRTAPVSSAPAAHVPIARPGALPPKVAETVALRDKKPPLAEPALPAAQQAHAVGAHPSADGPKAAPPRLETAPPNAKTGGVRPAPKQKELVYVYEVEAVEYAPPSEDVPEGSQVADPDLRDGDDLRPSEAVRGDVMPFEIRAGVPLDTSKKQGSLPRDTEGPKGSQEG